MLAYEANHHDDKRIELFVGRPEPDGFSQVTLGARAGGALLEGFATTSVAGRVMHELAWAPKAPGIFAFTAINEQRDYDLYVSEGVPLAPAPGADGGPSWSPDGNYLAFTSARTGQGDLYLLDVNAIDAPPRRLTDDPTHSELFPTWSADSELLVYVGHADDGDHLWLLDGFEGPAVPLTHFRGLQIRPRFAPSGRMLAFYANQEDPERFDLYVVEAAPGAVAVKLVEGVVVDSQGPSFTPDGQRLVYVADDDAAFDPIRMVPASGGAPVTVALDTVGHGDLAVTERGGQTYLAYVAQGRRDDAVRDYKRLFLTPLP
jgi:Tol biopolymer transport system component